MLFGEVLSYAAFAGLVAVLIEWCVFQVSVQILDLLSFGVLAGCYWLVSGVFGCLVVVFGLIYEVIELFEF
ncbi:hypothetical protein PsAD14_05581 [Pseudovibrio sp. Ad14]|nr:hypothetical protein PsAD14_05770 [Pseudovibrio sp. Ad14]KZL04123.1 hypothetical protein PsAD14_05581 [Pseudovibrio sp. Ad14]